MQNYAKTGIMQKLVEQKLYFLKTNLEQMVEV